MELKTYFAQDRNGNLIPSATVTIYLAGTNTLASGLTNVSNAPLSNPFTADADGKIQFHAPDGLYDMLVALGSTQGVRVTFQCVDVAQQLSDANSAAGDAEAARDATQTLYNNFQTEKDGLIEESSLAANDGEKYIGICPNIATLRTIEPVSNGQRITLREHTAGTGKGGGQFRAVLAGTTYTDNNGTIIKTTGGAAWLRINADILNPLMFGGMCDGVADDSDPFQNTVLASEVGDNSIFIPGKLRITKKITFVKPPQIRGHKYSPPVMGSFAGTPYAHTGCIIYSEVMAGLCFDINPPSNNQYIRGINLIDIHILARGAGVNGQGVRIANCGWGGYTRGLVIEGFKNGGLEASQLQDTLLDQLEILNCGTDNVVAALEITNGSNLLAFNRVRIEANEFQMRIRNSMMIDFVAPHFEQGDYPGAPMPEFEKINRYPSIVFQASQNIKFNGGFIFGATIQKQMSKHGITAADCPFHMSVGGDCSNIDFLGVTMGFGYDSGRILEHHGSGKVQNCTGIAWCTESYPLYLDGNIQFQNNHCAYTDNPNSDTFFLMAANYATVEGNIFACENSSSVNKLFGSLFALTPSKPILLGRNQYIINKRARFHDGTVNVINQSHDSSEQSAGGEINMQQHSPTSIVNLYGGSGGAATVTAINNMSPNQKVTFLNNGTGNITITNGGNIRCKGGVNADVPAGAIIEFIFNANSGVSVEISRSF